MDQFVVYILFSPSTGRTYTGMTSDLITRFYFHNSRSTKGFTTRFRPWTVIHVEFFESKSEAMQRESYLKTGSGKDWVRREVIPLF